MNPSICQSVNRGFSIRKTDVHRVREIPVDILTYLLLEQLHTIKQAINQAFNPSSIRQIRHGSSPAVNCPCPPREQSPITTQFVSYVRHYFARHSSGSGSSGSSGSSGPLSSGGSSGGVRVRRGLQHVQVPVHGFCPRNISWIAGTGRCTRVPRVRLLLGASRPIDPRARLGPVPNTLDSASVQTSARWSSIANVFWLP